MEWMQDKVVVVTGGASGIGAAIVREAVSHGARVIIADINDEMASQVQMACQGLTGEALYHYTDVTRSDDVAEMIAYADSVGELKFIANSAGLQTYGTAESTSEEVWDQTMEVNLKSMYRVCHRAIPILRKNGGGSIVNISSIVGLKAQRNAVAYATSKGAVIAMTRSMGIDHAEEGIYINGILPGSIDTPMLRYGAAKHGDLDEVLKEWGDHHPIRRIGQPGEIAKTVLFLWSPEASFIVGQSIEVDGGLGSAIF